VSALLLWLFFLLFSLSAVRNVVFFAFTAYFVFLTNYHNISVYKFLPARLSGLKVRHILSAALKVMLIFWMLNYIGNLNLRGYFDFDKFQRKREFGGGISLRNFPYKAADFLVDNEIKGNFFNDFNSGAYLAGRASPNIKVFIDGRTEVYGAEYFLKYRKIWKGDRKLFNEAAERYQLTGAFLNSVYVPAPEKTIRHLYKNKEWVLVYFDYDAAIFLRDIPGNRKWIDRYAMDLSQWQVPKVDLIRLGVRNVTPYQHINRARALFNLKLYDKAQEEAEEVLRVEPYNETAYKIISKVNIEKEEYDKALENSRKAKLLDPGDMETHYLLGVSFYHLGDLDQALAQCRKVLADNSKNPKVLFFTSLIYAKQRKYGKSINLLKMARREAPKNAKDVIKLGDLFFKQNAFQRARQVYKMALEIEPGNDKVKAKLKRIKD